MPARGARRAAVPRVEIQIVTCARCCELQANAGSGARGPHRFLTCRQGLGPGAWGLGHCETAKDYGPVAEGDTGLSISPLALGPRPAGPVSTFRALSSANT